MTDTSPNYRIWKSPESVLIQTSAGSIELSMADAFTLTADLAALLPRPDRRKRLEWTETLIAEVTRLYCNEGMGAHRIAKRFGVSVGSIDRVLKSSGVTKRPGAPDNRLVIARAARVAKRAAE